MAKARKPRKPQGPRGAMHGEGNPEADKRYREDLQRFAGSEESRRKAREAAQSLDEPPVSGRDA